MSNKEKKIIKIEPLAKSQERVYFEDGSKVRRCYGLHNPHYYEEDGELKAIDISHISEAITKVGKCHLRSKNIVSVGFRDDSNPEKYLGLRPDFNQKEGIEQLEFSIEKIEFNGKEIPIDLSKNEVINSVIINLGNVILMSNRQCTRQMVKVDSNISDFKITYQMHLKGLKVNYREDLDEYWIYSLNDEFRFRVVKPSIIDAETYQPIFSEVGENFRGLIKHSLIKQKDGTYFYIKEPTKEFIEAKLLAPYLIDADIYYSTTKDGVVYCGNANWTTCRTAATGTNAGDNTITNEVAAAHTTEGNVYQIQRSFWYFDTTGATYPSAVDFKYYRHSDWSAANLLCMLGTQADTLTTADYDNFSGSSYGDTAHISGWNTLSFNSTGIAGINTSGTTKVCQREKAHDVDGATPSSNTMYGASLRSYDYTGSTYDPYLEITEGSAPMQINISDAWKDMSEVKINIGDSWKNVTSISINIGDTWKDIF